MSLPFFKFLASEYYHLFSISPAYLCSVSSIFSPFPATVSPLCAAALTHVCSPWYMCAYMNAQTRSNIHIHSHQLDSSTLSFLHGSLTAPGMRISVLCSVELLASTKMVCSTKSQTRFKSQAQMPKTPLLRRGVGWGVDGRGG